jgi:ATP-binding cassette subfamily F protein 3
MTVLQVADLGFGYDARKLFGGVTFSLALGDRVSLVAPNGAGKSTLLRLVTGELAPDEGSAVIRKGVTVGYYRQSHELSAEGTVLEALLSGFQDVLALRHALDQAQAKAASGTKEDLDRLARATDEYHLSRGDELERKVEIIAEKLGFPAEHMPRSVSSLSGGERGRLHLGVVLAQEPDLLLLDEPTNHLDLDTIAWLEQHLVGYRGAIMVVSHDRAFLDGVTRATMELGRTSFRTYPLKYSDYAVAREADLEREREIAERQQAFVDKTQDFIRKNIAGQKTKQAQSRRKMLEKLDRTSMPEDVWAVAEKVAFRFAPAPRTGDIVLDAKGLFASRGGRKLFEGVDLLVRRGDRIGVVGPNGAGKSTLLKLLAGQGAVEDGGEVRRGTNLEEGYFDQHLGALDPTRTAVEEVRSIRGDLNVDGARQYLARFRFYGDDPLRRVSGYSGGERSRLCLAKLLLEPHNLLFLDEPTNHLDIPAAEILEEALIGFEGTVVLVSHDRRFLENVTTRTVAIRNGTYDIYPGGFRDYVDAEARRHAAPAEARRVDKGGGESRRNEKGAAGKSEARPAGHSATEPQPGKERGTEGDRGARRASFEQEKAEARSAERKVKRVAELEDLIAAAEVKVAALREKLKEDPGGNWEKIANLAREEQALTKRVESMMSEWTTLSEEVARNRAASSVAGTADKSTQGGRS